MLQCRDTRCGMVGLEEHRLPQSLPDVAGSSLSDGCLVATPYIIIGEVAGTLLHFFQFYGQTVDGAFAQGKTRFLQRAVCASRRGGCALYGTEVHHGLVPCAGFVGRAELIGQGLELMLAGRGVDGGGYAEVAGEHAVDIAVYSCVGQSKRHRGYGRCRVVAYAWQAADGIVGVGE